MGVDHSRCLKEKSPMITQYPDSKARAAKDLIRTEWAEVHTCGLAEWTSGSSCVFGFDHKIDYCIPQLKNNSEVFLQNIQPYCTRGYQFKIEKLQKPDANGRDFSPYKIPKIVNKRSRYVYPMFAPTVSIIGYQRHVAILQVVYKKTKELHFIAIELSSGRHLSVYRDIYISEPCIYEAYLSPNEQFYLLRPNFYFAYSRCSDPFTNFAITKDIKLISIKQYESRVKAVIEDISNLWHSIAFYPLSGCRFVALGNYTTEPMGDNMALFDLVDMKVTVQSKESYTNMSHHLVYNPQGTLLVSLGIRLMSPRVDLMYPVKVLFYDPNELTLLHCISRHSISVNHFHASLSPLFSKTGDYMALMGNFGQTISAYRMPVESSLKHLCRLRILETMSEETIENLPFPNKLKDYLLFQPQWS